MAEDKNTLIWVLSSVAVVVVVILILYLLRQYLKGKFYKKDNRIDGKVVLITGANTGIGKETALDLARRGGKIYLACRDTKRGDAARQQIIEETGNQNIFCRSLNLSSFNSIRVFAKKFLEEETRLDILINNAGIMMCPKSLTEDGLESQIGVNHFGHFLLTNLLLDLLKKSAPSRVVVVSSLAHLQGRINKDDLNSEKSYDRLAAYSQSKLANILFAKHLAKLLAGTGVTTYSLHPGAVRTELMRHIHPILTFISKPFIMYGFKTPVAGAQTTIRCAIDPELEKVTGEYYSDCKVKTPSARARDAEVAAWLWEKSEKVTGLIK